MRKYIKKFESFVNEMVDDDMKGMFSNFDKFRHSIITHPDYESNVLVAVYVGDKFIENEETGEYKKVYEPLTNIMKLTPDQSSFSNANGMQMRGQFQDNDGLMVVQWLDKSIADDMIDAIRNDWESEDGQFYLKTLVNHYKEHSLGQKPKRRG